MRKVFAAVLVASLVVPCVFAQEIEPIFLTTHNDDGSLLPILIKKGRTYDADGNEVGSWAAGTRTQDRYFGLHRFDDNRLLLGVFGNGINEDDPEDNQALAAQYPDRSLIWINARTGEPMGTALVVGIEPVELSQAYLDAYGAIPFFMAFDISDEGYIYLAYGESVLRYKPDGNDGFTGPETVFQLDVAEYGPEDWGISSFSVRGSGTDTQIYGGQNGTGFALITSDGDNFELATAYTRAGWPGISGAQSNVITNEILGEEWIFTSGYGNSSAGNDSSFYRLVRGQGNATEPFMDDADFWQARGLPLDEGQEYTDLDYQANYIGDVAGADGLPYIAAYSTPSWNTEIKSSPGFIAIHDLSAYEDFGDLDGAYIDDFRLDVYTNEEIRQPDGTVSSWYGTEGTLEVNIPSGAAEDACEIIWCGGIFGYGRFSVGDIGEPTTVSEWSLF